MVAARRLLAQAVRTELEKAGVDPALITTNSFSGY